MARSRASPLLLIAIAAALPAQKPAEIVRLKSGAVHEARRTAAADGWTLATALGDVHVPKADVAEVGPAAPELNELKPMLDGLHAANVAGQFAAARLAASRGVWSVAKACIERVFVVDPDHAGALETTAAWAKAFRLAPTEGELGAAELKTSKAWFKCADEDWVTAAMVVSKADGRSSDALLQPALKALGSEQASARWAAARVLAKLKFDPERVKPLYRASLVDRAPAVRRAAVRALRETNDLAFVRLYTRNLGNKDQSVRMTAGEALGEFGAKEAVEALLTAASGDGWRASRSFIAVTTQTAYVKDFDVEVAAGAVIADPVVDVMQHGVVLDVALVSIQIERHVYFSALRRITGLPHGDDLNVWRGATFVR